MALDEPSAQLHLDIRENIQAALATRRPILHHLNADSSWLLQIPRPEIALRKGGRIYYNILIDPWLSGPQSDVASWFSQQSHINECAVPSIAAVEELAREIDILAAGLRLGEGRKSNAEDAIDDVSYIDVVAVSHEFSDHCHKDTLTSLHSDVPVFAIKEAAKLITSWKHFRTVVTVGSFGVGGNTDWRDKSIYPLPEWISISRLLQSEDVLNYHAALLIAFNNRQTDSKAEKRQRKHRGKSIEPHDEEEESAEAVLYTPHGIYSGDLHLITKASPPIQTLAFLHGLHNIRVGTVSGRTALQSNLGAHNGLKAQRILNAKYWITTHDEVKRGGGLVSWFLQRDVITLEQALEEERQAKEQDGAQLADVETVDAFEGTNLLQLGDGESRVLV